MECVYVVLVSLLCLSVELTYTSHNDYKTLSRPKRYIVFPEGAQFSAGFCMSFKTLTDDDIYTGGMNLAVTYDLPNVTVRPTDHNYLLEPFHEKNRRHRRDIYRKLEIVFNSVGVDGRACMLRTLCEAAQRLVPRKSLVSELFRILFSFPLEGVRLSEPEEHHQYKEAHRRGLDEDNCLTIFPQCPVSLLDMVVGG